MRDADRVRERINIALEPRQVTWLVVGGLVLLGGLFTGGYLLGRQHGGDAVAMGPALSGLAAIDAASPASATPASEAADEPQALGEVEFMFPSALGSRPGRKVKRPEPVRLPEDRVGADGRALPPVKAEKVARAEKPAKKPARKAEKSVDKVARKPARTPRRVVERADARTVAARSGRSASRLPPAEMARLTVMPARPAVAAPATPRTAAPMRLTARRDEDAPPAKPAPARTGRRYTVQLKSAHEQGQANDFAAALRRKGYSPRVVLAQVPGRGKLYRVRVGEFSSRAEARRFQRTFRSKTGHADAGFITEL